MKRLFTADTTTGVLVMGLRGGTLVAKFMLTLFIARYMGLADLGLYGLLAGAATFVPVIAGMGLLQIVTRDIVGQSPAGITRKLHHYWALMLGVYAFAAILAFIIGLHANQPGLAIMITLVVMLEHLNNDIFYFLNNLSRARLANLQLFLRSAGWIYLFILVAFIFPQCRSIPVLLLFWLGGLLIGAAVFIYLTRSWPWTQSLRQTPSLDWYKSHLKRARVLYLSDLSYNASQYADRYLITLFLGLEYVGVYVLFWSMGNALYNLITSAIILPMWPRLIAAHAEKNFILYGKYFRLTIKRVLVTTAVLAVGVALFFPFILPWVKQPLAATHLPILWLVLIALLIRTTSDLAALRLYTTHQDESLATLNATTMFLVILDNLILLPTLNLYGAPAASLAAYSLGIFYGLYLIRAVKNPR